jgi:hypothetical protein
MPFGISLASAAIGFRSRHSGASSYGASRTITRRARAFYEAKGVYAGTARGAGRTVVRERL